MGTGLQIIKITCFAHNALYISPNSSRLLAHRPTYILSQFSIDLAGQFKFLQGAGIG